PERLVGRRPRGAALGEGARLSRGRGCGPPGRFRARPGFRAAARHVGQRGPAPREAHALRVDLRARDQAEGAVLMAFLSEILSRGVPVILQSEAPECGIACLAMVASYHGHRTDLSAMRLRLSPSLKGITLKHVAQIAETMGMTARGVQVPLEALGKLRLPAVLHWDMNHFVVLTHVAGRKITVHDPARGKRLLTLDEASRHFTGVAMEFTPTAGFQKKDEREKIHSWQLLEVASGLKGTIAQILLLSLALEVFAIAMPFFLQLTVDRVLVGRDVDLLTVLGIAFV